MIKCKNSSFKEYAISAKNAQDPNALSNTAVTDNANLYQP
jgi:hypothetical protein